MFPSNQFMNDHIIAICNANIFFIKFNIILDKQLFAFNYDTILTADVSILLRKAYWS